MLLITYKKHAKVPEFEGKIFVGMDLKDLGQGQIFLVFLLADPFVLLVDVLKDAWVEFSCRVRIPHWWVCL